MQTVHLVCDQRVCVLFIVDKPFDINIIKSRFPFSRDEITAHLKTMEPGKEIN